MREGEPVLRGPEDGEDGPRVGALDVGGQVAHELVALPELIGAGLEASLDLQADPVKLGDSPQQHLRRWQRPHRRHLFLRAGVLKMAVGAANRAGQHRTLASGQDVSVEREQDLILRDELCDPPGLDRGQLAPVLAQEGLQGLVAALKLLLFLFIAGVAAGIFSFLLVERLLQLLQGDHLVRGGLAHHGSGGGPSFPVGLAVVLPSSHLQLLQDVFHSLQPGVFVLVSPAGRRLPLRGGVRD